MSEPANLDEYRRRRARPSVTVAFLTMPTEAAVPDTPFGFACPTCGRAAQNLIWTPGSEPRCDGCDGVP